MRPHRVRVVAPPLKCREDGWALVPVKIMDAPAGLRATLAATWLAAAPHVDDPGGSSASGPPAEPGYLVGGPTSRGGIRD